MAFGFVAVVFNYLWPDTVFQFLLNSSGAVALFVWLVICFSQLRMRGIILRESPEKLVVRMWLFPYLTWATIGDDLVRARLHAHRRQGGRRPEPGAALACSWPHW